jgi:hypothetical protein
MAHPARFLAAALLLAALAVPASLQASGLSSLSPAARPDGGGTLRIDSWSFDWLFRFLNPTGRAAVRTRATDSSPDEGGGLDPNGRAPLRRHAAAKDSYIDEGGGLDPSGRAHSRVRPR